MTSSRLDDLLTRSEMYFGLTATLRSSVNEAELLQSLTIWLSIWTRLLFEKKSHISHKLSMSASDSPNSFITSSLTLGFHSLSESGRSSKTRSSSWSVNLRPIVTLQRGIFSYLRFLLLNYQKVSISRYPARDKYLNLADS